MTEHGHAGRVPVERDLSMHLSPPFLVLPPTSRFPYPVVAHGEHGLVAVVTVDRLMVQDVETGEWDEGRVRPEDMALDAVRALSAAARAPEARLACVVWLPGGIGAGFDPPGVCTSGNAVDLAKAARAALSEMEGGGADLAPWIGAYAAIAIGPTAAMEPSIRRVVNLVENVVAACAESRPLVCHGRPVEPYDLADPRFLLPALATAAFEDWGLVVLGTGRKASKAAVRRGFSLSLEPDPTALLGYRVERLTPSQPFIVLAPIVSALRRCRDVRRDEFVVDYLVEQFARYLHKHGLDATVVEDVELRMEMAEGEDA